jgi:hypothetical protein
MNTYLESAAASIRKTEKELEDFIRHEPPRYGYQWKEIEQRRNEITERWLKLASIERGLNPYALAAAEAGEVV